MPSDSLPYTLFLILAEIGLGGATVLAFADWRGQVTRGFLKATVVLAPIMLALAAWVAVTLEGDSIEGYRLDTGPRTAIAGLMIAAAVASALHTGAILTDRVRAGRALGWALVVLTVVVLLLTAVMLRLPAWNVGLVFSSLLLGSLAVGLATVGLALGHWYLVTPRLPPDPLNQIVTLFLVVVGLQVIVFVLAVALPVDETPLGGRDRDLEDDVTFWLRIVVGFVLPLGMGWMALASSRLRSMMAATGLLYVVTALVLAAEIGARALMFDSGRPI